MFLPGEDVRDTLSACHGSENLLVERESGMCQNRGTPKWVVSLAFPLEDLTKPPKGAPSNTKTRAHTKTQTKFRSKSWCMRNHKSVAAHLEKEPTNQPVRMASTHVPPSTYP